MSEEFDALVVTRKTGQERLHNGQQPTEFNVLDFWQWSSSDLIANALRGRFAEYIDETTFRTEGELIEIFPGNNQLC